MSTHGFSRVDSAPAILVVGIRRHHRMSDAQRTVPAQWSDYRNLNVKGGRVPGAYCGMSGDGFEYMTGRNVPSFEHVSRDIDRLRIPAQTYAVFNHEAHVAEIGVTWNSIWRDWLHQSGYQDAQTPPFELYADSFDPETGMGGLEIWFPIRRASSNV